MREKRVRRVKAKKEKVRRKRRKILSGSKCKLSKRLETRKMPLPLKK